MRLILKNTRETGKPAIREDIGAEAIAPAIRIMNWNEDGCARLEIGEKDWIEISGNEIAGFSIMYSQFGCRFLTRQSPDDVEDLIGILGEYAAGNDEWKSRFRWHLANPEKKGCLAKIFLIMGLFLFVKTFFAFFHHRFVSIFKRRPPGDPAIASPENDPEMNRAIGNARESISDFYSALEEQSGECGKFTLRLEIRDKNGVEHLWLKDIEKNGDTITGTIDSRPRVATSLKQGDRVDVDPAGVTDWGYFKNRRGQGFHTLKALLKNMPARKRKMIIRQFGWTEQDAE